MFSNNTKIASFYPNTKHQNNGNYFNQYANRPILNQKNPPIPQNNFTFFNKDEPINFQDKSLSISVELALLTVNLSFGRFKTMSREELDNYVKTNAYNNSYDSRKYLLALDILNEEMNKLQNHVIKQILPLNKNSVEKTYLEKAMGNNKINMNEVVCIEPDEFKLNTSPSDEITNFTGRSHNLHPVSNVNNTYNQDYNYNPNSNTNFASRQNRNVDMLTYNGNPMGTFKITNSGPGNSLRPNNQSHKLDFNTNHSDNMTNITNTYYQDNMSNMSNMSNTSNMSNMSNMYNMSNIPTTNNHFMNSNSIIQQSSVMANPLNFQINGGRRRTSNLDVGSSDNYVIIK